MVANSTKEFVFEVLDAQQDMVIKYTILCLVILYTIYLWWMQKDLELNTLMKIIFKFSANIFIYITMVFFPLFTIMLFREYPAIELWTLLVILYGVIFLIIAFSLLIFGWEKVFSMMGIDINIGEIIQDTPLKGENK